jgi:hypothetical protein
VLHSNTLTSHSPSASMLRGVSIIGLPQFAQVGDWGMVSNELRACHGCSGLSCYAVSLCCGNDGGEINPDCERY